jgi:hypothetical protein
MRNSCIGGVTEALATFARLTPRDKATFRSWGIDLDAYKRNLEARKKELEQAGKGA